jgi:hypothetical protein
VPQYKDGQIFAVFNAFDIDKNGFLEWNEYQLCLDKLKELELSKEEGLTVNIMSDTDGDGKIDYAEFMKHFEEIVFLIKFNNALQTFYDELPDRQATSPKVLSQKQVA